ncbi:binding--dependent transport system inner membrane component family protein [Candidatus Endolissoclinum faulkneri L2]|uniref:Binding--dependent transport system inner membrane component family protein n=1 Tax=Candidatus Endolissoclinum faulkneri L2 TaxID=1193729 RepID=K7ZD10_9PROT|nr:carbohydrate ABC transporter permease [Candidatus Endolissoclinum faulkneri]AFX99071.1 binding--dependent transport system inner membrane component family protein [Candidatus Endolissoclinum faulkneri L2]
MTIYHNSLTVKIGLFMIVSVLLVVFLFPFYYALITSFKSGSSIFEVSFFPEKLTLENYIAVFEEQPFGKNFLNSLTISIASGLISLLFGMTAALPLGRFRFKGQRLILLAVLIISMFPQVAVLSGMFELIRALGLFNNWLGLVLCYLIFTLPFTVWVLTTFIRNLPVEVEEAAILDGANPWVLLTKIFFPMMRPAIITTSLLVFVVAWNEFLFAMTFTLSNHQRTLPVAIALISGGSQFEVPWGKIMAASAIVTVPMIALVLIFQRQIVSGLTTGAVKG